MDIKTIDLNGQLIRVAVRPGLEKTTPLLLCNGIGASIDLVMPFIEALRPELTVIAFDVPGVGGSPAPLLPYRFSGITSIMAQLLDYLNYGQVDTLGLSWGGFLAQQFANDYPQRCRKLVLAATTSGVLSIPPSLRVLGLMSSPRRYTDPNYAASIAPEIYGGQFRRNPALAKAYAEKMTAGEAKGKSSGRGYYYQVMAVYWWSSLPWLHTLKQPTLVLAGDDDPLVPLINMKVIAYQIPKAELHVLHDGHLFLLTDLERVLPILTEFLERPLELSNEHDLDAVPSEQIG